MRSLIAAGIGLALVVSVILIPSTIPIHADNDGIWYLGEGLKKGDFISYKLCQWDYSDCQEFQMDIWIDGDMTLGTQSRWTAQVIVLDGDKSVRGTMELGKIAAEPFGRNDELKPYRDAFKASVAWLGSSASETSPGSLLPGEFIIYDKWVPIGIVPHTFSVLESQKINVSAGLFDAAVLQSDITPQNKIWITDGIPFPIKAEVYLDRICDSGCPLEYRFELLNYSENIPDNPFEITGKTSKISKAIIMWDKSEFSTHETGIVKITDYDKNMNPDIIDTFLVRVWSDSNRDGIEFLMRETDKNTGNFVGDVTFTPTDESSGRRLQVNYGDTITVEYNPENTAYGTFDNDITTITSKIRELPLSPLKQQSSGIFPMVTMCREGFERIFRPDSSAACVSPLSAEKLVYRGWSQTTHEQKPVIKPVKESENMESVLITGINAQNVCTVLGMKCPADKFFTAVVDPESGYLMFSHNAHHTSYVFRIIDDELEYSTSYKSETWKKFDDFGWE